VGSQLSRPYQIALVGAVLLLIVWFVALRPKGESSAPSSTPAPAPQSNAPQTSFGKDVQKARGAAAASNGANQKLQQAAGATAAGPQTATPPTAAAPPRTAAPPNTQRPTPNARTGPGPRVLVLLFWNAGASDDRAVRGELKHVDLHHGRVKVMAAPIADVGRYKAITAGVDVLQSPTVIVLDTRTRQARTIAGYADVGELDHAVAQTLAG
jgi:hypothetical protein